MIKNLNADLLHLGLRLSVEAGDSVSEPFDIEKTIFKALEEIITKNDVRLFAVLASWIVVHGERVNLQKYTLLANREDESSEIRNLAKALVILGRDTGHHNFGQAARKIAVGKMYSFNSQTRRDFDSNKFNKSFKAFHEAKFYISEGSVRIRESDVLPPEALAKSNAAYAARIKYGSNWRSDLSYLWDVGVETAYRAAKICGCSNETARKIYNDQMILKKTMY